MKENVIDVLMFLFDNYLNIEAEGYSDEMSLALELEEAGFMEGEINKAFDWLGDIADLYHERASLMTAEYDAVRILTEAEKHKLDAECQGFLMTLQAMNLLDAVTREIIIESAMKIEVDELNLQEFKRIVGLVVLNSPRHDEILIWVEDLIYDDIEETVH